MNKFLTFMRESSTARFFMPAGLVLIIIGVAIYNSDVCASLNNFFCF